MKPQVLGFLVVGCLLYICPSVIGQDVTSITLPVFGSQTTDMTIAGVKTDTAPWIGSGSCTFSTAGDVKCKIKGVLIPDASGGSTGGVTAVAAGLVCNGVLVGTTTMAPLSLGGVAKIKGTITVPSRCGEPIALIEELEKGGSSVPAGTTFIAVSAFGSSNPAADDAKRGTDAPPDR